MTEFQSVEQIPAPVYPQQHFKRSLAKVSENITHEVQLLRKPFLNAHDIPLLGNDVARSWGKEALANINNNGPIDNNVLYKLGLSIGSLESQSSEANADPLLIELKAQRDSLIQHIYDQARTRYDELYSQYAQTLLEDPSLTLTVSLMGREQPVDQSVRELAISSLLDIHKQRMLDDIANHAGLPPAPSLEEVVIANADLNTIYELAQNWNTLAPQFEKWNLLPQEEFPHVVTSTYEQVVLNEILLKSTQDNFDHNQTGAQKVAESLLTHPDNISPNIAKLTLLSLFRDIEMNRANNTNDKLETQLIEHLTHLSQTFTPEKLQKLNLSDQNLVKLISLIQKNPVHFLDKDYVNKDGVPVYQNIHQLIEALCVDVIQQGQTATNEALQIFGFKILNKIDVSLLPSKTLIENLILQNSEDSTIYQEIMYSLKFRDNDADAFHILLDIYPKLSHTEQVHLRSQFITNLNVFFGKEELTENELKIISEETKQRPEDITNVIAFFKKIGQRYPQRQGLPLYDGANFSEYAKIAVSSDLAAFTIDMVQFGLNLQSWNAKRLTSLQALLPNRTMILSHAQEIARYFPNFTYSLYDIENPDPYYKLASEIDSSPRKLLESITTNKRDEYAPTLRHITDAYLYILRTQQELPMDIDLSVQQEQFYHALVSLATATEPEQGSLGLHSRFFYNKALFNFLARYPDQIDQLLQLPQLAPELFATMQGPLQPVQSLIAKTMFSSENPASKALLMEQVFTKQIPLWERYAFMGEMVFNQELRNTSSQHEIQDIATVPIATLIQRHKDSPTNSYLTRLVGTQLADELVLHPRNITFSEVRPEYKRTVYADILRKTIETSENSHAKEQANARNRAFAQQNKTFILEENTKIHATRDLYNVGPILTYGILPGESVDTIEKGRNTSAYNIERFNTHFSILSQQTLAIADTPEQIITSTDAYRVSQRGAIFVYPPGVDQYVDGAQTHGVILGGVPATEATAMLLLNKDQIDPVIYSMAESGLYVPIYLPDETGKFVLAVSPEDYDQIRAAWNLGVPVERWEASFKIGEQLGSNEGGTYAIGGKNGIEYWYVKYGVDQHAEHVWAELLADKIYQTAEIPVVETKAVSVNGVYGRASRILEEENGPQNTDDINNGFIIDAWIGNWDLTRQEGTQFLLNNHRSYRYDNGGNFYFKAEAKKGRKQGEQAYTEQVDLESMRERYPILTDEQIQQQVAYLVARFTDATIDSLVDSVRLHNTDRDRLKDLLKARRDYIVAFFRET